MLQFSWALDFSRSGSNSHVREAIDRAYHSHHTSLVEEEEEESGYTPHEDSVEGEGEGEAEAEAEGGGESDDSMQI